MREQDTIKLWLSIIGIFFLIYIYPEIPKFQHPRWSQPIWVASFLVGVTFSIYNLKRKNVYVLSGLLIIFLIYFIFKYYSIYNVPFPETIPISNAEKIISEGNYKEFERIYPKKPIYITSVPAQISWLWLNISNSTSQIPPKFKEAYIYSNQILNLPLFENEKSEVLLEQVLILLMLHDTKRAKEIFKEVKNTDDKSEHSEILNLESQILEREGKFKEARQKILSAISKLENNEKNRIQQAKIYNNLARMEMMLGNTTNTQHYYRKSLSIAVKLNDKSLLHTIYPNLIDTYLLNGLYDKAQTELNNYKDTVNNSNIYDQLQFLNYELTYSRQKNDTYMMSSTVEQINRNIYPKLPRDQQLILKSSELRIRWNMNNKWDEILFWVEDHLSEYQSLPFPENFNTIKEAYNILDNLAKNNKLGEFKRLFLKVTSFMGESKVIIGKYIDSLPDYCINERCYWENELVFLSKIRRSNEPNITLLEFYKYYFKHMCNIKDINYEHKNYMLAIEKDIDIAEECMGGIRGTRNKEVIDYLRNTMKKHLDSAIKEINKFEKHPNIYSFYIRISMYSVFLGDKEISKDFFYKYEESRININHYSKWIQDYYFFLKNYHSRSN